MTDTPAEADQPPQSRLSRPAGRRRPTRRRRLWAALFTVAMLAVAIVTLRSRLPSPGEITTALRTGDLTFVAVAAVFEAISLSMFARQQQSILRALSVRMSLPRALAVTYARSALAISMPAGSAVSAGFAFQQYRRSGASREQAAAVAVLSGLISFFGLAALYIIGALGLLASEPPATWHAHPGLVLTTVVGLLTGLAIGVAAYRRGRATAAGPATGPDHVTGLAVGAAAGPQPGTSGMRRRRSTVIRAAISESITAWRTLRPRHWATAGAFAMLNWLTDLLCLAAAARAFGLPVGLVTLAGIYLGVQLIRQIPLTPGGIGLIETGLLAGLTAAGSTGAAAAAAVLTYRLLSCWLLLPIGGLAALALRRPPSARTVDLGASQVLLPVGPAAAGRPAEEASQHATLKTAESTGTAKPAEPTPAQRSNRSSLDAT